MEVYGEKPKLFSEKWWENYFYYYKVHTIVGICALFVIGYIIYSDVTATKYDIQIDYISELGMSQEQGEYMEELAEGVIDDVTGNEVCDAFVMMLDFSPTEDMQYAQAMQVKYVTEMGYSEGFVFIASKNYMEEMSGNGVFEDASVWSGIDSGEEFVSLSGCSYLLEKGMPADDLYIAVRKLRDKEVNDEKKTAEYENGIKFAQFLIDER